MMAMAWRSISISISIYLSAILLCVSAHYYPNEPSHYLARGLRPRTPKHGGPTPCNQFFFRLHTSTFRTPKFKILDTPLFPVGLLPEGVTGYSLNNATGEFSARLNGSCSFTLENSYGLRYNPEIKGLISQGRLQKLSGVSVKVALLWLNIVEVKRNHEKLEFSVGFTSADFPVENFEECPKCGCGLDCNGENWLSS